MCGIDNFVDDSRVSRRLVSLTKALKVKWHFGKASQLVAVDFFYLTTNKQKEKKKLKVTTTRFSYGAM